MPPRGVKKAANEIASTKRSSKARKEGRSTKLAKEIAPRIVQSCKSPGGM